MSKTRETLREVILVSLMGSILLGVVLLTPNCGAPGASFMQTARATTWGIPWEWPAAWCSMKMILLSISLFLLIDSFGTFLLVLNYRRLAGKIFFCITLPFLGILVGGFYLIKSLF
jgi:hypothetical protein